MWNNTFDFVKEGSSLDFSDNERQKHDSTHYQEVTAYLDKALALQYSYINHLSQQLPHLHTEIENSTQNPSFQ